MVYSFPGYGATWSTNPYSGYGPVSDRNSEPWSPDYLPMAPVDRPGIRAALQAWANVANIRFVAVADTPANVGDIRFAYSGAVDADTLAHAYAPGRDAYAGDVWFNARYYSGYFLSFAAGTGAFQTALHEIGHALGLRHPFDRAPRLPAATDNFKYTLMAYDVAPGVADDGSLSYYPTTPMAYDIDALQRLYGPNLRFHAANNVYTYYGDRPYFETIWDPAGLDTLRHAGTNAVTIDLRPGHWSTLGQALTYDDGTGPVSDPYTVAIHRLSIIENATGGAGGDRIIGNGAANVLSGGDGDDYLHGAGGNDTLYGGRGNDRLIGGGGADRLNGGPGDDSYHLDHRGDIVIDGSGYDTVTAVIDYTLPASIEVLILGGRAALNGTGNALDNVLRGNAAANALTGMDGDDVLIGNGGADTLIGGAGRDTFVFATPADGAIVRLPDFLSGTDVLRLAPAAFASLPADAFAPLPADWLAYGPVAVDASHVLLFDGASGYLSYDADANGPGPAVPFARIDSLLIAATDIFVMAGV
ncbi:MAG: M10 family metallopeptidase [Gammaproteobacteria bacterium]|nr:M10 family metallopeptidase [Gammaproteobacteria bacterium]